MSTESGVTPPNAIEAYVAGLVEGYNLCEEEYLAISGDPLPQTIAAATLQKIASKWGMTPEQIIDAKRRLDELVEDLGR